MTTRHRISPCLLTLLAIAVAPACGDADDPDGTLRVTVYGEEFVEASIPAQEVVDGWAIDFTTLLVALDGVHADGVSADSDQQIFDITRSSGGGGHLVTELIVPSGRVEHLDYRIGPASEAISGNASADQVAHMNQGGHSIWVEGVATRGTETIAFAWGFATDTRYVHCHTEQDVPAGGTATSQATIHADHFFYDDLESSEPNVAFDLIASADADMDGTVTQAELRATDITGQTRYQVGTRDIEDLWGFLEAQTQTLGHIDGEGHCEVE